MPSRHAGKLVKRSPLSDTPLDLALDEIRRLRKAIETHRDAIQNHPRAEWIDGIDIALWLTLSERYR